MRLLCFAAVLVVVLLLQLVPVLGQVAGLLVGLVGIGSLALALGGRYRAGAGAPAPRVEPP